MTLGINSYGIKPGQVYHRADGTDPKVDRLIVVDSTTFADCDDVVVKRVIGGLTLLDTIRIDAFKLARVRYFLAD